MRGKLTPFTNHAEEPLLTDGWGISPNKAKDVRFPND